VKITKSELEVIIREEIKEGGLAGHFDPSQRGTFKAPDPVTMELYDKLSLRLTDLEGKLNRLLSLLHDHFSKSGGRGMEESSQSGGSSQSKGADTDDPTAQRRSSKGRKKAAAKKRRSDEKQAIKKEED